MRHPRHGVPRRTIGAAIDALVGIGDVVAVSPIVNSDPLGPSARRYANACAMLETNHEPESLLAALQRIECEFARRRIGMRWRARTLDLDIVFWSGGIYALPDLAIPHPQFRERPFATGPASAIAPDWRDPLTGLTLRQLHARLTRNRPLPSASPLWSGR